MSRLYIYIERYKKIKEKKSEKQKHIFKYGSTTKKRKEINCAFLRLN